MDEPAFALRGLHRSLTRRALLLACCLGVASSWASAQFSRILSIPEGQTAFNFQGQLRTLGQFDGKLYAAGSIVAATPGGSANHLVYVSDDGINWQPSFTGPPDTTFHALIAGPDRLVAAGGNNAGASPTVTPFTGMKRPDSIWTGGSPPVVNGAGADLSGKGIAYGFGQYLMVGANGQIFQSTDGLNWAPQNNPGFANNPAYNFRGILFDGTRFVVSGSHLLSSTNGETWHTLPAPPVGVTAPYFLNGTYYLVGGPNSQGAARLHRSTDLQNWTTVTLPAQGPIHGLAYADGLYIATGGPDATGAGFLLYSRDGNSWTHSRAGIDAGAYRAVLHAGGAWYITADTKLSHSNGPGIYRAVDPFPSEGGKQPGTNIWQHAQVFLPGILHDASLGYFASIEGTPWIYAYARGWLYPEGGYAPHLWLYDDTLASWIYINRDYPGWLYQANDLAWYWFDPGANAYHKY